MDFFKYCRPSWRLHEGNSKYAVTYESNMIESVRFFKSGRQAYKFYKKQNICSHLYEKVFGVFVEWDAYDFEWARIHLK